MWTGISRKLKLPIVIVSSLTLDQYTYIELLNNEVVPYLKSKRAWRKSIQQQDGARQHTLNFSLEKLNGLVLGVIISTRTEFEWPPVSYTHLTLPTIYSV